MIDPLAGLWQRWLSRPRSLYVILCIKTIIVMFVFLFSWALENKDAVAVYMRF